MAVGGVPQFGLLESGIMPRMDRLEGLGLAGHLSLSQFDSLCLWRAGASSQRAILREAGCPPYSGLLGKQEEGRARSLPATALRHFCHSLMLKVISESTEV